MAKGKLFRRKDKGQDFDETGDNHSDLNKDSDSNSFGDMVDDDTDSDKLKGRMPKGIGPSQDNFVQKFLGKSKNTKKGRLNFSKFKKR